MSSDDVHLLFGGPNCNVVFEARGLQSFQGSQPTTCPTKFDVLYDFRVLWQSPRLL
jgi:hypothetical protein